MIFAGLKKCIPRRLGVGFVTAAIAFTLRNDVLVARIATRLGMRIERRKYVFLDLHGLKHRLDDEISARDAF